MGRHRIKRKPKPEKISDGRMFDCNSYNHCITIAALKNREVKNCTPNCARYKQREIESTLFFTEIRMPNRYNSWVN